MISMRFSSGSARRGLGGAVGLLLLFPVACGLDESGLGGGPLPLDGSALDGPSATGGDAGTTTNDAPVGGGPGGEGGGGAGAAGLAGAGGAGGTPDSGGAGGGTPDTGGAGGAAGSGGAGGGTAGAGGGGMAGRGGGGGGGEGGRGCDAASCPDGCCEADICVRTRSTERCGTAGAACRPCGACQLCSEDGRCRIDPPSRWTIAAGEVRLTDVFPGSGSWDPVQGERGGPAPDPFVQFENPAGVASATTAGFTTTLTDQFQPSWDGEVITPKDQTVSAATLMDPMPAWLIWVGDEDGCNASTCAAEVACQIRRPVTEDELMDGRLRVEDRHGCARVELDLVCVSP